MRKIRRYAYQILAYGKARIACIRFSALRVLFSELRSCISAHYALCCSRTDPAVSESLPLFDLVLAARQLIDCRLSMVINIVGYGLDGSVKV